MNKKISIVVPIYNRANTFSYFIESLYNQTDKDFTVIVVDNKSTDNLKDIVKNYIDKGMDIKHYNMDASNHPIENICDNPALQINVGVNLAESDYVLINPADVLHDARNVENARRITNNFTNNNSYYAKWVKFETTGDKPDEIREELISRAKEKNYVFDMEFRKEFRKDDRPRGVPKSSYKGCDYISESNVLIYYTALLPVSVYNDLGGIDEEFLKGYAAEDGDFGRRLELSPHDVFSVPELYVIHPPHPRTESYKFTRDEIKKYEKINLATYQYNITQAENGYYKVNEGKKWGLDSVIVERVNYE